MKIDIVRQVGAITRTVATRELDGRPASVVQAARTFDTTVDDVWEALTSRERLPRWFLPVSGDLRLGGRYQLEGNAGGTITACEPPRRFSVTWEFGGGTSWVTVELFADGDRTRLELEHVAHVEGPFHDTYGPGAVGVGWDLSLVGLDLHLTTRADNDPAAFQAWNMSPEGIDFTTRSSDAWGRAAISGGTDEPTALARVARTTAFYTGASCDIPPQH